MDELDLLRNDTFRCLGGGFPLGGDKTTEERNHHLPHQAVQLLSQFGYVVNSHGDRKYPKDRVVGPFQMAFFYV